LPSEIPVRKREPGSSTPLRGRWWMLIGWLVSITLLVGMLRTAPLSDVGEALKRVQPGWLLGALALNLLSLLLRGHRWAVIFAAHRRIPLVPATGVVMIGLGLNAVLPGRIGELVRIGLGVRNFGGGIAFNAATVVMERLLDAVTLLGFLFLSLFLLPSRGVDQTVEVMGYAVSGDQIAPLLKGLSILSVVLVIGVLALTFQGIRRFLTWIVSSLPGIGTPLASWTERILGDLGKGFDVARRPRDLLILLTHSGLIWFGMALANLCVVAGFESLELSLLEVLVLTAISVAVASIPAAPGAWGVFEAGALLSLVLLGVAYDPAVGLAFVLVVHMAQYVPVILLGLVAAIRENLNTATVREVGYGLPPGSCDSK
jgi:uncharacterized protein (TIRG00374 family)